MDSMLRRLIARILGERAEREAARTLRRLGMRVITRGYRTSQGEVDLIARDGSQVVFVEVKARRHGQPAEAVDLRKQKRLTMAALHFLKRHNLLSHPCRFDVVAVIWPEDEKRPSVQHIKDAFPATGLYQLFR